MDRDSSVLVFLELCPDKRVLPISWECVTAGRKLADALRCGFHGLIMGNSVGEAAVEVSRVGLDGVYTVDHPLLESYHPETYGFAMLRAYEQIKPKAILTYAPFCAN